MLYNNKTDEFTRRMVKGSFSAVNRFSSTFFVNRSAFAPMDHARNGADYAQIVHGLRHTSRKGIRRVFFFFRRKRAGTHERTQLARLPTREIISALRQRYTTRRISISGTGSNSRRNLNFAADRAFSPASTDTLCFPFLLVVRASLLLYCLLILRFLRSAASRVFLVSLIS